MTARNITSKNVFIHTHDQLFGDKQPLDVIHYARHNANNQWLYETAGSVVSRDFGGGASHPRTKIHERPFCMASQWVSILQIPWLIQPGLSKIYISLLARVSNGRSDELGVASGPTTVFLSARFPDHSESATPVPMTPKAGATFSDFYWSGESSAGQLVFDVSRGSFREDAKLGPFWTVLNILIKSDGVITGANIKGDGDLAVGGSAVAATAPYSDKILRSPAAQYANGASATFPNFSEPYILSTTVENPFNPVADESRFVGPFDILATTGGNRAFVWGHPTERLKLREPNVGTYRMFTPYVQIKSLLVREEFLDDEGLDRGQQRFGRPAYDDAPRTLLSAPDRVLGRRRCVFMGGPGYAPRNTENPHLPRSLRFLTRSVTTYSTPAWLATDSIDHNFRVAPLSDPSGYTGADADRAEILVGIHGSGYVNDFPQMPLPPTVSDELLHNALLDDGVNDEAYPDGLESMRSAGLRGFLRVTGYAKQVNLSSASSIIVGVTIGEEADGTTQSLVNPGYLFFPIDFLSLRGFHPRMGLHAYLQALQSLNNASWALDKNFWQGWTYKEGYQDIGLQNQASVDIQRQLEGNFTIPIKLNPALYRPEQPLVLDISANLYIPNTVDSWGLTENVNRPDFLTAHDPDSRPAQTGEFNEFEIADGTFTSRHRLAWICDGISAWVNQ